MKTQLLLLPVALTDEEKDERRKQLADNAIALHDLKEEKAEITAGFTTREKDFVTIRARLVKQLKHGTEDRQVECSWIEKSTVAQLVRLDTGEVVRERQLTPEEMAAQRQTALPFEPPVADPKPADPNSPATLIASDLAKSILDTLQDCGDLSWSDVCKTWDKEPLKTLHNTLCELTLAGYVSWKYGKLWGWRYSYERAPFTTETIETVVRAAVAGLTTDGKTIEVSATMVSEMVSLPTRVVQPVLERLSEQDLLEQIHVSSSDEPWYLAKPVRKTPALPPASKDEDNRKPNGKKTRKARKEAVA